MSDRRVVTSSLMLFGIGTFMTAIATYFHAQLNHEILIHRFDNDAKRIATEIEEISHTYVAEMHAVKAMLLSNERASSPSERADIFLRYMYERNVEEQFIGLYGIGIIDRVPAGTEQAFIDEMSAFYGTPFNIKSIRTRPAENADHWIISTVYPSRNNPAIGLDITTETKRYAAMMQTLSSVQRHSTGFINLVQIDNQTEFGYLMYQPIVGANGQIDQVVYFLSTYLFMLEKLGAQVLESFALQPMQISVYDRVSRQCLIHFKTGTGGIRCEEDERYVDDSGALQHVLPLDKELYVITPSAKYLATSTLNTHWVTAIVGLMFSVIGVFYLMRLRHEKVLLESRVLERTKELQQSLEEAQAAETVKQEFLRKVSHELRTPLNGIMGVLQILTKDIEQEGQRDLLKLAEGSAFHLLGLVEDILDTAKFNHGTFLLSKITFELKPHLVNVIDMLDPSARAKKLALNISLDEALPQWVIGDERRLRQVLINLIGNAIKFTDVGEVNLSVFVMSMSHGEVLLRFKVEDTGIGIPPDKQAEIFEEFRQVSNGLNRQHDGAGLGLSITRNILEAMGSHIKVFSERGVGSCFQFDLTLPIASRPQHDVDRDNHKKHLLQGKRVIVVDDINVNLLITQSMLESQGAEVRGFLSAQQAIQEIMKSPDMDVLITDVQMPVMDGLQLARKIRELGLKQLPIIGLSGNSIVEDKDAALASGMNEYLHKPVILEDLIAAIQQLS